MEVANSTMGERQRSYRETYRSRITGGYNGYVHAFLIFGVGSFVVSFFAMNLTEVLWWEWLAVPVVFLAAQWIEYVYHRFYAHRPSKSAFMRLSYVRHTLMHHQFFTAEEPRSANHKDWRVTLFPPFTLVIFTLMALPPALLAGWLLSPNVGWLIMATAIGSYMFYELLHLLCHCGDNWFVRNCPIVNTSRRHHLAHHDPAIMMEVNMSIVFPFWDWVYGTSDLNRGLLGHLFNGYNTKYVKKDLRRTKRSPTLPPHLLPRADVTDKETTGWAGQSQ